jgi:CDP-glucose 4,6-dehydratase
LATEIGSGMTSGFWSGRCVLVTGHTGFKGAWLSDWLMRQGAYVIGFALPPQPGQNSLFQELRLNQEIDSVFGDVRDRDAVRRVFGKAAPEIVFHLAAQAIVRVSYDDPLTTFATNVVGTANVLDTARDYDTIRAIVVVTSDKCYADRGLGVPYREEDPLGGNDPYSASKAAQEMVAASYRASFFGQGPLLATVRAGNVIGGGDWSADRLVPDIVAALASERPVVLRYPQAVRPWQHVLEPLHAYLTIAERLHGGDALTASAWNVGPVAVDQCSVSDIAERFFLAWGQQPKIELARGEHPPESAVLRLDASKAQRELGISPRFSLDEACERTARWYRSWSDGVAAKDLCAADIAAYESLSCTI